MKFGPLWCVLPALLAACATPVAPPPAPAPEIPPPALISRIEAPRPTTAIAPRRPPAQSTLAMALVFAPRMSRLSAQQEEHLASFAAHLRRSGTIDALTIEGHADEPGSDKYRLALAGQRAERLARLLALQGLPQEKISTTATLQRTWERPPGCRGATPAARKKLECVNPGTTVTVSAKITASE